MGLKRCCFSGFQVLAVLIVVIEVIGLVSSVSGAALLGGHIKNDGVSAGSTKSNSGYKDDYEFDSENQSQFEPIMPPSGSSTYEANYNVPNNHRESYGPLTPPKTYNQYAYPLISSSYTSMKIQGNNKNKVFSTPDFHPNLIKTSPHQFPPQNDINIIDLIPDYNSNAVITNPTSSSTTESYSYEFEDEEEEEMLPKEPEVTTTTTTQPTTQRVTTTTRRTTTRRIITTRSEPIPTRTTMRTTTTTTTTPTPEEADSIFNKFLMEIFQTTDLDNIDNKIVKNTTVVNETIPVITPEPVENFNYFDYEESYQPHNDSTTNKTQMFDYYDDYKPVENVTVTTTTTTTTTPTTTTVKVEVTSENLTHFMDYDRLEYDSEPEFYDVKPLEMPQMNGHQNFNLTTSSTTTTTTRVPIETTPKKNMNPLMELLINDKPKTTTMNALFATSMPIETSTNRPVVSTTNNYNYTLSMSLVPPVPEKLKNGYTHELAVPLQNTYDSYYHNQERISDEVPDDYFKGNVQNDVSDYFPQQPEEPSSVDYYSRPLENTYPLPPKTEPEVQNISMSQKLNRASNQTHIPPNDKILALNSQPMYHQLPTDLTPPLQEKLIRPLNYQRPHRPESGGYYPKEHHHKHISDENLPNILPQFRPNAKVSYGHPPDNVGTIHRRRYPPYAPHRQQLRIVNDNRRVYETKPQRNDFENESWGMLSQEFPNSPPRIPERIMKLKENEVATLQMIKSQQTPVKSNEAPTTSSTEFPLYVVYPTNHTTMNVFATSANSEKNTQVVVGKRTEQPMPPTEIAEAEPEFQLTYPTKKTDYPILSDFPYRIERPNTTFQNQVKYITPGQSPYLLAGESEKVAVVNPSKEGVVVGIGAEVPAREHIAIAYTPTERSDHVNIIPSMGAVYGNSQQNEFTVSAIMHTTQQKPILDIQPVRNHKIDLDVDRANQQMQLDFQAPFQASASVETVLPHAQTQVVIPQDNWAVIPHSFKDRMDVEQSPVSTTTSETFTQSTLSNKEFDFENFKPQLFGGFKPIIKLTTSAPEPAHRK